MVVCFIFTWVCVEDNDLLRGIAILPLISTGVRSCSRKSHQELSCCKEQPSSLPAGLAIEAHWVSQDILPLNPAFIIFNSIKKESRALSGERNQQILVGVGFPLLCFPVIFTTRGSKPSFTIL